MPIFDRVPLGEAKTKTASGKRAQIIAEYVRYIKELQEGEAGRLQAAEGEPITTVRRRLGAAARQLDSNLMIRRTGDEIYFWAQETRRRRSGRPGLSSGARLEAFARTRIRVPRHVPESGAPLSSRDGLQHHSPALPGLSLT